MKCCHCGKDATYSTWKDSRACPACGRKFVCIPRNGDPCSDGMFARAIEAVSAEGRVRWGVEHLYYELNRRIDAAKRREHRGIVIVIAMLAGFAFCGVMMAASNRANAELFQRNLAATAVLFGGMLIALFVAIMLGLRGRETPRLHRTGFERLYARWVDQNGPPPGVIARQPSPPPSPAAEPDLGDYSFDRAVICDRARTVDLLLANNFHFENNCAVLSVGGYPQGPFEVVRGMLKRNPQLAVYALHDATPEGCRLAHTLATDPDWFAGSTVVIDVGLRPSQAEAFKGSFLPGTDRDLGDGNGISAWERKWLGRYRLELAVIRPEQVVKRLFRAINQPLSMQPDADNVIYLPPREPVASGDMTGSGDSGRAAVDEGMAVESSAADGAFDAFG